MTVTQLPANLLESFIPGYSLIANFFQEALGFDITLLVSICLLGFGIVTAARYVGSHALQIFEYTCTSSISFDDNDDIYDQVMDWIAAQTVSQKSRALVAKTNRDEESDTDDADVSPLDENNLINYSNLDAKISPKFQPSFGTHYFFHKGNVFSLKRDKRTTLSSGWGRSMLRDDEEVTVTCIGRSTRPIKDLLAEARRTHYWKDFERTCIRRAASKDDRSSGIYWQKAAVRPTRPLHTVVLDSAQKEHILNDINEYLHPTTKLWYAHRGIPYRRGYLFHGPPGTGKSSLAGAIAGVFGLDIYCISLVDPTLTEEELSMMFTDLPHRCVVLLEDIDTAGLHNRHLEDTNEESISQDASANDATKLGAEISKAIQQSNENNKEKKGITLSGLLNAIDGVASHEGRVLVMTTNRPDKLDEALIRPGRVDMQVEFTKATRPQMHELFTRMYSPEASRSEIEIHQSSVDQKPKVMSVLQHPLSSINKLVHLTPPDSPDQPATPTASTISKTAATTPLSEYDLATDIGVIATRFANLLPENTFTPAEIQGFLLTRKKEPLRALEEAQQWKDATLAAKEKKAKISKSGRSDAGGS